MGTKLKYTINNLQRKRNYEEVNIILRWGMIVFVLLVCIVLYSALNAG